MVSKAGEASRKPHRTHARSRSTRSSRLLQLVEHSSTTVGTIHTYDKQCTPEAGQGSGRAVCYSCTRRSLVPHSFAAGPCTASMKVRSAVRPPGHVPSQWKNTPATDRGVRRSKHSILHVQGRGCCPSAPVARGVHECYEKVAGAMCKTSVKQMGRERQTVGNTPVSPMV